MKKLIFVLLTVTLITGLATGSMDGHHYHGCSMKMSELSEIDSNQEATITFDEFSASQTENLKIGFRMLDTNNDELISKPEWDEFLKVHGYVKQSEG